jgi:DNA repair exonuclease SbcCD nuclease subunit
VTIVFADLHLKESTEEVCFQVLDRVAALALADDRHVVFCGDWWHLRYQVNVRLLNRCRRVLSNWCAKGIVLDLVPGNHDQVSVDGENALEALAVADGIRCWTWAGVDVLGLGHRRPTLGELGLGLCPYRKDPEAQLEALKVAASGAQVQAVFAHFGLRGASMNTGKQDVEGLELPWWKEGAGHYPLVILGHYHRHQWGPDHVYVGSPYQQSFGEAGNTAGVLQLQGTKWKHVPLDIGPRYWVIDHQAGALALPAGYRDGDHVRLDVRVASSQLAEPALLEELRRAGAMGMTINVLAAHEAREHRFALQTGESLGASAERFVRERVTDPAEVERRLVYLRKWTGATNA